jgi:FkbM family methyltransferase
MYTYARGEGANDPRTNGEYWLLERLVLASEAAPILLLDIGANRGDWTAEALRVGARTANVHVHSFEPSRATRSLLMKRFAGNAAVTIHASAMSDRHGTATFYASDEGAGTNSLSPVSGPHAEVVSVTTVDDFLRQSRLDAVSMMKIDAEGYDPLILRGAEAALGRGLIDLVQFEYNWRWLLNHACLRDIFDLIADKPYRLGKLAGDRVDYYETWHPELDRFFESNYVLVRKAGRHRFLGFNVRFDGSNVATIARQRCSTAT